MNEKKGDSPAIQVVDAMRLAWESGVTGYTPHYRDDDVCQWSAETPKSRWRTSARSLPAVKKYALCTAAGKVCLFVFVVASRILATGFGAGQAAEKPRLLALAKFAAEVGLGERRKDRRTLRRVPRELCLRIGVSSARRPERGQVAWSSNRLSHQIDGFPVALLCLAERRVLPEPVVERSPKNDRGPGPRSTVRRLVVVP